MRITKGSFLAAGVFAAALNASADSVVGRFQREGASVLKALPLGDRFHLDYIQVLQ